MSLRRQKPKKKKSPLILTDKWQMHPTEKQRLQLSMTVEEYRRLVRALIGVVYVHWPEIADAPDQIKAVEVLIHQTKARPLVLYDHFDRNFHKFPSYLRRAAIHAAIGQVSSFVTRYNQWQSGIRSRRDAKPPRLTADTGIYPNLYQGQCILFGEGFRTAQIKVWNGSDWVWTTPIPISGHRNRHLVESNERKSPQLIVSDKKCQLSQPFQINPHEIISVGTVLAVDLGMNTTATAAVVGSDGTVKHKEFIHPGRDIDRRDQRLKRISTLAKRTIGGSKKGKLHKGFCRGNYRKATNINREIGQKVSRRLVEIATQFSVKVIVFENLKGWRPKGGKHGSTLRQRYHGWLHRRIVELTEQKWGELGGTVEYINPAYTSKYAYDGSGEVRRDSKNYALARFQTGKRYNADLNGVLNIAARYWHRQLKLSSRNGSEVWLGKNSSHAPRTPVTLSVLWAYSIAL